MMCLEFVTEIKTLNFVDEYAMKMEHKVKNPSKA